MSFVQLKNIRFSYDSVPLFHNFSLELEKGELHCLLGPSGCGKSTILHLLAGFLKPEHGEIQLDQTLLTHVEKEKSLIKEVPTEKRGIGVVFQEHCLFPHLTVEKNIHFGINSGNKKQIAEEVLSIVELSHKKNNYPSELSGGEQQRVAIARTLATKPKLLLMDEPFSGLDQDLRTKLRREIQRILKKINLTTIIVTHSQDEAFELGDRVTIIDKNENFQTGTPIGLLKRPQFSFLVKFLNSGFFIQGKYILETNEVISDMCTIKDFENKNYSDQQEILIFVPFDAITFKEGGCSCGVHAKIINKYNGRYSSVYELKSHSIVGEKVLVEERYLEGCEDLDKEFHFSIQHQDPWILFSL